MMMTMMRTISVPTMGLISGTPSSPTEVRHTGVQDSRVVMGISQQQVACSTQEPPKPFGRVTMIDVQTQRGLLAHCTGSLLSVVHFLVLIDAYPVAFLESVVLIRAAMFHAVTCFVDANLFRVS